MYEFHCIRKSHMVNLLKNQILIQFLQVCIQKAFFFKKKNSPSCLCKFNLDSSLPIIVNSKLIILEICITVKCPNTFLGAVENQLQTYSCSTVVIYSVYMLPGIFWLRRRWVAFTLKREHTLQVKVHTSSYLSISSVCTVLE